MGHPPVVVHWLGLPAQSTRLLYPRVFEKRLRSGRPITTLARKGLLDQNQVLVALVTITLFVPCVANFFMMVKERGWKVGLIIASVVVLIALLVGGLLNWALILSGWKIG